MSDRLDIISMFESGIIMEYELPNTLVDQFITNATIEFAPIIDGVGGRELIVYTPSVFTGEVIDTQGTFNRVLLSLEKRIISYYLTKSHLVRLANGKYKEIGYSTGNMTIKNIGDVKRALRQELADLDDSIDINIDRLVTPGEYNG